MNDPETLKKLVSIFKNSVTEAVLAWAINDAESFKRAQAVIKKTYRAIKKQDKKLNSLAELMESSVDDSVKAAVASWVLQEQEERSLKILDVIARKDNDAGRYAAKYANKWREKKQMLERKFKSFYLIISLIILSNALHIFSFLYRGVYYGNSVDYWRIANNVLSLTIGTLYLYSQKDNFGYYFSVFYFSAGLIGSVAYFALYIPQGLFHQIATIGHVTISGSTEILCSLLYLTGLSILLRNGAKDIKQFWVDRLRDVKRLFQFKFHSKQP